MTDTNHNESTPAVEELPFHGIAITIGLNISSDAILAAVPPKEGDGPLAADANFAAVVVDSLRGDSDETMKQYDARITQAITNLLTGKPTQSDVILMGACFGDVKVFVEREDHRSCWESYMAEIDGLATELAIVDEIADFMAQLDQLVGEAIEAQRQQPNTNG